MHSLLLPPAAAEAPSFGVGLINALIMVLVVFAVLCLLSAIIWTFGRLSGKKKTEAPKPVKTAPAAPVPAPATSEEGDEVVAAIAAAVSMMDPAGKTYQVKKITPVRGQAVQRRSEWAAAAVRQNTAPF